MSMYIMVLVPVQTLKGSSLHMKSSASTEADIPLILATGKPGKLTWRWNNSGSTNISRTCKDPMKRAMLIHFPVNSPLPFEVMWCQFHQELLSLHFVLDLCVFHQIQSAESELPYRTVAVGYTPWTRVNAPYNPLYLCCHKLRPGTQSTNYFSF